MIAKNFIASLFSLIILSACGGDSSLPADNGNNAVESGGGTSNGSSTAGSDGTSTSEMLQSNGVSIDVATATVQELGVDEPDAIKTDGEYLYVLSNEFSSEFTGNFIPEMGTTTGGTVPEPGTEEPEFITKLRIHALENDVPDATLVKDLAIDLKDGRADGMFLHKAEAMQSLIVTSTGVPIADRLNYYELGNPNHRSTIAKVNVSEPGSAVVEKTLRFDGQLILSRRIGSHLFIASKFNHEVPVTYQNKLTTDEYKAALEQDAELKATLPKLTQLDNGVATELVDPSACYSHSGPNDLFFDVSNFASPSIISLSVIDLDTLELLDSECSIGSTLDLLGSFTVTANSMYFSSVQPEPVGSSILDSVNVTLSSTEDLRGSTDIHRYKINGGQIDYSGSGVVAGQIGSYSEHVKEIDGFLHVITRAATGETVSPIIISVLDVRGAGELKNVAELPNDNNPDSIGESGARLFGSLFLGDRLYLTTNQPTSPWYVVDFSDQRDPKVIARPVIDGFYSDLRPIGQNYLLGIGSDAVPDGDGNFNSQGHKLSLISVSDGSNPTEVESQFIEAGTAWKRNVTVQSATTDRPTRVAYSLDVADLADPQPNMGLGPFYPWSFTGLHGFDIKTGADAGIEQRGVMAVSTAENLMGNRPFTFDVESSVIVDDSVYFLFGTSVYAANWDNLQNFSGPR